MADNFLEKRMEELRSGRLNQTFRAGETAYKRTGMNFPFPPKRVLIATDIDSLNSIINLFLKTGSRVAAIVEYLTADSRIREYGRENIEESFEDILKAWRDIDIMIADEGIAMRLIPIWEEHRERYPYVSDYRCRIILIGDGKGADWPDVRRQLKCTINRVVISTIDRKEKNTGERGGREESRPYISPQITKINPETRDISGLIGMIVLPVNDLIDGMTFRL